MLKKLLCLANSYKEGGRCVAGIELDGSNQPVFEAGRPQWIRPVCNTTHGEIPTRMVEHLRILNIIELDVTGQLPQGYQSENVSFEEQSLRVVGQFDRVRLRDLCDQHLLIFGNRGRALSVEAVGLLDHSLMLLSVTHFEVVQRSYADDPGRSQPRLIFGFQGRNYNLPITDPIFLEQYRKRPDLLKAAGQVYLTISLGILWEGWHYKMVAGII